MSSEVAESLREMASNLLAIANRLDGIDVSADAWSTVPILRRSAVPDHSGGARRMTTYEVAVSPKSLRETLCIAQSAVSQRPYDFHRKESDIAILGALIAACDRHRPLGPDGKHGDRHTPTCGCEDA